MNCLITGASGFIFSNVLDYFLEHTDWEFTCLASWRHKGNPLRLTPNPRVRVVTHDLIGPIPEIGTFDYIVNGASESHVDRSIESPVRFIENNVSIALQMLEYARTHPPKVFLQFSTDEVFGAREHAEWDLLLPSNPYAASKACQEVIAIAYWKTYKVPVVITNSNNIIGKNQDPEKFIPKIVDLIRNDEEVTIHTAGGEPASRCYNPVQNVADALLFILKIEPTAYDGTVEHPDRYALPGGEERNNLEMAELVAQLLDKPLRYRLVDANAVRPGYDRFYPETDGTLTKLGWVPRHHLLDELREAVST